MEQKKRRHFIYFPIYFAIALIAGIFIGRDFTVVSKVESDSTNIFKVNLSSYDKVNDVINYIYKAYVDTINRENLKEDAITGILENLDPHSYYVDAKEFEKVNDPLLGSFDGIGIEFRIIKDTVVVLNTILGGPSEKVGMLAGDRIVKVEGETIAGVKITNEKVIKLLKGKSGTRVNVSVYRRGVKDLIEFTITRDKIPMTSLDIAYMITDTIGYIKISRFSATTHKEFVDALTSLQNKGMKQLVLDLRGNGGGYLDAAIDMADELLPSGDLLVYTKGKSRPKTTAYATSKGRFEKGGLAILIDDWSASASEIVSGAVQDNDRGWVIGRRSFGKGLVQEQIRLADGSAIRLTVARYYTPAGRCIQKPYEGGKEQYYTNFYNRFVNGEVDHPDSIHFADSLKYKTEAGRTVYGGGGIMPDIFVPVDRKGDTKYFKALVNKGLIYRFAFDYADDNREYLEKNYPTKELFLKRFIISTSILNKLMDYAKNNGVEKDMEGLEEAKQQISTRLKAYIGRNILSDEGFYPVLNQNDKTLQKALEVLKNNYQVLGHLNPAAE